MYTLEVNDLVLAAATAIDLFEVAPAANKICRLHALIIVPSYGIADTEDEVLRWRILRGFTVASSSGATPTPAPVNHSAAAGFTAKSGSTTLANTGTPVTLHSDGFFNRSPYQMIWSPEMRPSVHAGSSRAVIRIEAPANAQRLSATLYVGEEE
jgi:hypothetical protein